MRACRKCHFLIDDKKMDQCPNCNSTDLSEDHSGIVIIIDPEKSEIAKKLNINSKGKYALKVR